MRRVSLNYRIALDAANTDEVEVVLAHITHPDLDAAVKLSTDPTERLSVEPIAYGTHSTWMATGPQDSEPFSFILMDALLPDDQEDAPPAARLAIAALDSSLAAALRSTSELATVSLAVVLASTPDVIEAEFLGLKLVQADGDAAEIVLSVTLDPLTVEPSPPDRMTRARFPGLHR